MKFKIGDKVRYKPDVKINDKLNGLIIFSDMYFKEGEITDIIDNHTFKIKEILLK